MSKTERDTRIELVQVGFLQANDWNPNVMQPDEYEALKQDMRVHGINALDPLLVSPCQFFHNVKDEGLKNYYVIVDGEHRWRMAVELAWKEIRCEIRNISEDDAKALCYRRNRERGTIDPFKEALLFKSEGQMTQAKIAGKYGVDQSQVSHRLSLLKLDQDVVKTLKDEKMTHVITPSHLEPLATLAPVDQKRLAKEIKDTIKFRDSISVNDVENRVQRLKRDRANEEALKNALETAKFPKCPTCKEKPTAISHESLPWVRCRQFHTAWNLETGKREYEFETSRQKNLAGESKPIPVRTIRSVHTTKELLNIFVIRAKEVVPNVDIRKIQISGKLDGKDFGFDLDSYWASLSVSWHRGDFYRGFRAEDHEYKTGEKSSVDAGSPDHVQEVKDLIENAFNGKLGIDPKRSKKPKSAAEEIHELHSSPSETEEEDSS